MAGTGSGQGGKRPGAGRKPGTLNKRTREIAEQAAATGDTPADVMMSNMRYAMREANAAEIDLQTELDSADPSPDIVDMLRKRIIGLRGVAQEAAKDAAPYFHPRLAAIAYSGGTGMTLEQALKELDDEDDDNGTDAETEGDVSETEE
jgi:hypothetical protein